MSTPYEAAGILAHQEQLSSKEKAVREVLQRVPDAASQSRLRIVDIIIGKDVADPAHQAKKYHHDIVCSVVEWGQRLADAQQSYITGDQAVKLTAWTLQFNRNQRIVAVAEQLEEQIQARQGRLVRMRRQMRGDACPEFVETLPNNDYTAIIVKQLNELSLRTIVKPAHLASLSRNAGLVVLPAEIIQERQAYRRTLEEF